MHVTPLPLPKICISIPLPKKFHNKWKNFTRFLGDSEGLLERLFSLKIFISNECLLINFPKIQNFSNKGCCAVFFQKPFRKRVCGSPFLGTCKSSECPWAKWAGGIEKNLTPELVRRGIINSSISSAQGGYEKYEKHIDNFDPGKIRSILNSFSLYFYQRCCRGASAKGGGALNTWRAFFGALKPPRGHFRGAEGASKIGKILLFHRKNQYLRRKSTIDKKIFQNFVSKKNFLQKKIFFKIFCKKNFFAKIFFSKKFSKSFWKFWKFLKIVA